MAANCDTKAVPAIGFFERYLTAWVALCIVVGIGLGQGLPDLFKAIGASNFFELAVAAISLFGFHSGAALATVVGVLIEVPVMLLVVRVVNASKPWYEAGLGR